MQNKQNWNSYQISETLVDLLHDLSNGENKIINLNEMDIFY